MTSYSRYETVLILFRLCHSEADAKRASAITGGKGEAEESQRRLAELSTKVRIPRRCVARNDTAGEL
jgi:hypothetical protein